MEDQNELNQKIDEMADTLKRLVSHHHNGNDFPRVKFTDLKINNIQNAITKPTGGSTIDSQARTAINSIIDTLKALGVTK